MVEAVGIEPTSGNPQPQASTSVSGLSSFYLVPGVSSRQEALGTSLIYLAPSLRPGTEPALRIWRRFPRPAGATWPTLADVRPPGL